VDVWRVLNDCLSSVLLHVLKLFELLFVLFVNVLQVFLDDEAFQTHISLLYSGEERGRCVVQHAVDSKGRVGKLLDCVHQERIIYNFLTHVAFHIR